MTEYSIISITIGIYCVIFNINCLIFRFKDIISGPEVTSYWKYVTSDGEYYFSTGISLVSVEKWNFPSSWKINTVHQSFTMRRLSL